MHSQLSLWEKKKLICNNGTVIHKKPVMFSGGKLWRGRRCDISGTRLESKDSRHRSLVQKQKKKKVSHMTNSSGENEDHWRPELEGSTQSFLHCLDFPSILRHGDCYSALLLSFTVITDHLLTHSAVKPHMPPGRRHSALER